jgi:HrpA-like RNA helicase
MAFKQLPEFFANLPVCDVMDSFLDLVDSGKNVVIQAPTGSGKSTSIPLWLYLHGKDSILVIEPRRVACRSLASFLARSLGEKTGETIGYRIRFEDVTSARTAITFVTPGVAVKMLDDIGSVYKYVILDEFHERRWETDLIEAVLASRRIPFVITSATINGVELAEKIGGTCIKARGKSFPVQIIHSRGPSAP